MDAATATAPTATHVSQWEVHKVSLTVTGDTTVRSETGYPMRVRQITITYETLPTGPWSYASAEVRGHYLYDHTETSLVQQRTYHATELEPQWLRDLIAAHHPAKTATPPSPAPELPWYADHANLVTLLRHLADRGHDADSLVHATEKPWSYDDEYAVARAIADHEAAHPDHTCRPHGDGRWYCDTSTDATCEWTTEQAPR